MADFSVRSDSVDVEQIMRQIRARIREKRGADYTEAEVQQLAKVKLEKFLDPRGIRSDLVDQFRRREYTPSPPLTKLELQDFSIYGTHRGALRWVRQILQPILKLFVNLNPLVHFVWTQSQAQAGINDEIDRWMRKREHLDAKMDPLYYELLHNLVVELTRTGIEVHNLKMRLESQASRLDFDERRGRSLEQVVEYRAGPTQPPAQRPPQSAQPSGAPASGPRVDDGRGESDGGDKRRRRRRRRRRPGQTMGDQTGTSATAGAASARGPREDSESSDAGARASGGGAPLAEDSDEFDDEASDQ